ncbi:hypothetical protein, partial [Acinetobacter baumannii]|uniref:hypothetical protein n=1 Tax=Acinetobacter baumannii TaxID=470 RepID=UPI001C082A98
MQRVGAGNGADRGTVVGVACQALRQRRPARNPEYGSPPAVAEGRPACRKPPRRLPAGADSASTPWRLVAVARRAHPTLVA